LPPDFRVKLTTPPDDCPYSAEKFDVEIVNS
jgi:hypothetical protein